MQSVKIRRWLDEFMRLQVVDIGDPTNGDAKDDYTSELHGSSSQYNQQSRKRLISSKLEIVEEESVRQLSQTKAKASDEFIVAYTQEKKRRNKQANAEVENQMQTIKQKQAKKNKEEQVNKSL